MPKATLPFATDVRLFCSIAKFLLSVILWRKKQGCEAFAENLELVNSELKIVIPHMLYNYFFLGFSEVDLNKVVERVIQDNPAGLKRLKLSIRIW